MCDTCGAGTAYPSGAPAFTATNNNKKRVKGKLEKYPYINIEVIDRISICLRRDDIRMDRQTPRNQNNVLHVYMIFSFYMLYHVDSKHIITGKI
jgi:hypothetical protein